MDDPLAEEHSEASKLSAGASAFLGLGLSVAVCMAVCVGLGILADALAHTSPAFMLVGLACGVVLSVLLLVSTVRKYL